MRGIFPYLNKGKYGGGRQTHLFVAETYGDVKKILMERKGWI